MFGFSSSSKNKGSSPFVRFFKSVISIVVLSAFVLVVSLFVKEVSSLTPHKFASLSSSLLSKINIHVDEKQMGEVAGKFVSRLTSTGIVTDEVKNNTNNILLKVCILADIHQDTVNLEKALTVCKNSQVDALFLLGDLTDYGDVENLEKVKNMLSSFNISYYAIPGDRDLGQSVGADNFIKVFGKDYELIDIKGKKFLMVNNSANYTPLEFATLSAVLRDIPTVDYVLFSQPVFTEGLVFGASKYMGSINQLDDTTIVYKENVERLNEQRLQILSAIRSSNVTAVFAGEHHYSSDIVDPSRDTLTHFVVGAVSSTVHEYSQNLLQKPRFTLLSILVEGGYKTEEIVIE